MPVTKDDTHRVTLRAPFEADVPRFILPSASQPRLPAGEQCEAMPIESAYRNGNRGNEPLLEHKLHGPRRAHRVEQIGKGYVKPWCGRPNNRTWGAPRFDRFF